VERVRTGADLVLEVLVSEGADVVFGYPGGAIMPLHDALFGHRVRHVLMRHEASAAFAASGYARSTGRVGVCIATSGPGATNLVTGIADAMLDNVPLVAITGQVKSDLMGTDAFQEISIASITQPITKRNVVIRSVNEIVPALHAAFRLARGPRPGPVLVDMPSDILKAGIEAENFPLTPRQTIFSAFVDSGSLQRTIDAIARARKPVLIVGGGARWANAAAEFRLFCKNTGVPHAATLHGLGCADMNDPNFLGMVGMHGWTRANRAVAQADVIVALGMRFDDRVTGNPKTFAPKASIIVHADIDASEFNKVVPAQITLHGDLLHILRALNARLNFSTLPSFAGWGERARSLGGALPSDISDDGHLSATNVLDAFFDLAPADAIVTTDVGQHQMWAAQRARPCGPEAFLSSGGLGSMGFGFPAAIGAKFAHPERTVVAIVGDGGFQMSLNELATLRRYGLVVKILLIDNRNLGMVRQWQQLFYRERYSATSLWDNPDFSQIARAYGITARSIDATSDLRFEMNAFLSEPSAMLLHAACYPHGNVFPMIPSGAGVDNLIERVAQ
jgi:acetolactate synthase I/II/III large subunit